MISLGDIVTLNNNNSYTIVNMTILDNDNYFYICNINNFDDVQFCKYNNGYFEFIDDSIIQDKLIECFINI